MKGDAAMQADYCDLKFIKSRKIAQIILEIPIEQSDAFIAAFGSPRPDITVPVALARLTGATEREEEPETVYAGSSKPKGGKLAQRAGIICAEKSFQQFAYERLIGGLTPVDTSEEAARLLREQCGVESRAELDHNPEAAAKFNNLMAEYNAWLKVAV